MISYVVRLLDKIYTMSKNDKYTLICLRNNPI